MAEQAVLKRKCDHCGEKEEFPAQFADLKPEQEKSMPRWVTLVRVFSINGQPYAVQKHACKDSCATNILQLGVLDLPQQIKEAIAKAQATAQGPSFAGVDVVPAQA
jgi:hypothetical protein